MDIVALSNGLYGSISVDWGAPPPWNIQKQVFRGKRNVMTHYLQGYLVLFQYSELHTMMIGSKMFQDEFMKINNILSGIRNKDICPEVNLYKTLYEC